MNEDDLKYSNCGMDEKKWNILLRMIHERHCTPFLGAGACWPTLPLGSEVARKLAEKYYYPLPDKNNLPRVTQYIATETDPLYLKLEVKELLKKKSQRNFKAVDELHRILAKLPFPIYITTNYDDFLIKSLKDAGKQAEYEYCRWNRYIENLPKKISENFDPSEINPLVYHLHGIWDVPQSIVLTEDDYIDFLISVSKDLVGKLHHRIIRSISGTTLLFIGYDLQDISFRSLFKSIIDSLGDGLRHTNVSVQLLPEEKHKNILKQELEDLKETIESLKLEKKIEERMIKTICILNKTVQQGTNDKRRKNFFYKKALLIEQMISQLSIADFQKEALLNTINNLQDEISQMAFDDQQRNIQALKFFETYFKNLDICIYWGEASEFIRELLTRWTDFSK